MFNCDWRRALFGALMTTALLPGNVLADRLVMKNGDVITGNVSKIEDQKVYIDPSYADEFSVKLAEVESIETVEVFEVELDDGSKINAQFAEGAAGTQTIVVDGQEQTVEMMTFALATEPEKWYDRESHVDVNMTWNGGNTDSRNNLIFADTSLKLGDHRHFADLTIRRDEVDGISTKKQDLIRYNYNWMFSKPWYMGATASYERDPIRELDHRYTLGLTFGRDIFNDARKFLTAYIGAGYSEEQFAGEPESGATAFWRLDYTHDFRNGDLEFFHNQTLNYQLYANNNAILKTNTGFRLDIIKDVYTTVSLRYDYETEPAAGAENQDTTFVFGVGAKF